ncbi:rho GTPase-activating protein 7 isoform X6 [Prinia subflava]|uniref:rho GTPase-activating protein 7 isoform X6 n=1 Tax=Prinia subflava TaxID=208062 RepID=UPI002FE14BAC
MVIQVLRLEQLRGSRSEKAEESRKDKQTIFTKFVQSKGCRCCGLLWRHDSGTLSNWNEVLTSVLCQQNTNMIKMESVLLLLQSWICVTLEDSHKRAVHSSHNISGPLWKVHCSLLLICYDMSLAIRKKSWEEHVTQWMGLALEPVEYNTACRHGLVADNLQTGMEKDEVLSVDRKEKCASFPECCYTGEGMGFPERQLGNVSKEVDENDNHEDEERFLKASTETLIHVSDDDDDCSALNLDSVDYHITALGSEPKEEGHNLNGAGSLSQVVPITEGNKAAESSGSSGDISEEPGCDTVPKEETKKDVCGSIGQSLELCNYEVLNETVDVEKENCIDPPNVEEVIMSGKQLLHTAVIAQQRWKSDAFKDGLGKSECNVVESGVSSESSTSGDGQLCLAVQPSNSLMQSPPCPCIPAVENGLDGSGFTEPQVALENKCLSNVSSAEDIQCLHVRNHLTTHENSDNQVKLRKRKEITEDRDRSRLDSMVLLIMKLDQLDQDIENALSAGSSPSSTPTYKRRHIPDVESGSESGVDVASVNHMQTNLSSNIHAPDLASPSSVASSGAKPKAGVSVTGHQKGLEQFQQKFLL